VSTDWLSKIHQSIDNLKDRVELLEGQVEFLQEKVHDLEGGLSKDKRLWADDDGNEVIKKP
jgi:chaperonin cofactor prefoldin